MTHFFRDRPPEPAVVVFKRKDRRPDGSRDKCDVVRSVLVGRRATDVQFFEGARQALGRPMAPANADWLGVDVDSFDSPIVCVHLTAEERVRLAQHPDVELIEDDTELAYANGAGRPRVEGQPALDVETIPAGVSAIMAPPAWGNSLGKGIRVAVVDSGIDSSHPDLAGNVIGSVGTVQSTPGNRDEEGHGTFCAGIIGAEMNGAGIVGIAPQASLHAVKVSALSMRPSLRSVIAGLDWCLSNQMHVIHLGLGMARPSYALYLMCERARLNGALVIASAGNDGTSQVTYPAAFDNVVGVGAIDERNVHYRRSNRGIGVDLCAPGVDVLSTGLRRSYQAMSGTSAAAAHVAGAAVLAWGAHRFSTAEEIWSLLASTARPLGNPARFGYGRVDALAASASMLSPLPMPISGYSVRAGVSRAGRREAIADQVTELTGLAG